MRLITERTASGWAPMSYPKTVAVPDVGWASVASIRTIVVFPAPFGPSRDTTVAVGTARSKPSTAVTSPYLLVS